MSVVLSQVLAEVRAVERVTVESLAHATGFDRRKVERALSELEQQGSVKSERARVWLARG